MTLGIGALMLAILAAAATSTSMAQSSTLDSKAARVFCGD
jgi:hypothetical protein